MIKCRRIEPKFKVDFFENKASNEKFLLYIFDLFFRVESSPFRLYHQLPTTLYNNLILFWFFVSVKDYEVNLSRRSKTAAHEIGLQIRYNIHFYLKKNCLYSLNIYKTTPQNSIASFLSFPSKKKSQKDAVLGHSNSGHSLKSQPFDLR